MALRNLGIDHEVVAIAEIDKYAIASYEAIHGPVNNVGDISLLEERDIPECDLFTYSFPCQDLSTAGLNKGFAKGSGTRSSLLWECERVIKTVRPTYLLLENVKNLIGKKNKEHFNDWLRILEGYGYTNYYKVLNAKDYSVPQNRERVFVVSILEDRTEFNVLNPYCFPNPSSQMKPLKELLEIEAPDKYYLPTEKVERLLKNTDYILNFEKRVLETVHKKNDWSFVARDRVYNQEKESPKLRATMHENPIKLLEVEEFEVLGVDVHPFSKKIEFRGYRQNEVVPCILASDHKAPKTILEQRTQIIQKGRGYNKGGLHDISPTLSSHSWHENNFLLVREDAVDSGVIIGASRGRNPENPSDRRKGSFYQQRLELNSNGVSNTITTVQKDNLVITAPKISIRKMMPIECWRLMGFRDEDFKKAETVVSNTQLYKQAGNSIVVPVLEGIFRQLFMN